MTWSRERYLAASSPTTMSPKLVGRLAADRLRSSARRIGRPTILGNVCSGKSVTTATM